MHRIARDGSQGAPAFPSPTSTTLESGMDLLSFMCFSAPLLFLAESAIKLAQSQYLVLGLDYEGFGMSSGIHGYIPSMKALVDDVVEFTDALQGKADCGCTGILALELPRVLRSTVTAHRATCLLRYAMPHRVPPIPVPSSVPTAFEQLGQRPPPCPSSSSEKPWAGQWPLRLPGSEPRHTGAQSWWLPLSK